MPLRRLQREMSSAEFAEYLALDRIEPWGARRLDVLVAGAVATVVGMFSKRRVRLTDFLPAWWRPPRPRRQSTAEATAVLRLFADAHNRSRRP